MFFYRHEETTMDKTGNARIT